VGAFGGPLQHPIRLALHQEFVHEGGCVHATVAEPWTQGRGTLEVVHPDNTKEVLTSKHYCVPRDTLHIYEWNSGPAKLADLAQVIRGTNQITDDEAVELLCAMLHALYEPSEELLPPREFEDCYGIREMETCRSLAPRILCNTPSWPLRVLHEDARVEVLLPASTSPFHLNEWAWPLLTACTLKNETEQELFGVPPSCRYAIHRNVARPREEVEQELQGLEIRCAVLRALLDSSH